MESVTGTTQMMTMTESSTLQILTQIVTWITMQICMRLMGHFTVMTVQTMLIQTSMVTVLKMMLTGMMITMVSQTDMIQTMETVVLLIQTIQTHSQLHSILFRTRLLQTVLKTVNLTPITPVTGGQWSMGTIHSLTWLSTTMDMTQQQTLLLQEKFQNSIGTCMHAGLLIKVATTGTQIQTVTL